MNLLYSTSNKAKYIFLCDLLSEIVQLNLSWIDSTKFAVKEGNNALINANNKSIKISRLMHGLILSSDDSIIIFDRNKLTKPTANIYRNVSPNRNTTEIINYYIDLINQTINKELKTKFISYYSIAKDGNLIINIKYDYFAILKIPSNLEIVENMPLSALHYIPQKNCFYNELPKETQLHFHRMLIEKFKKIMN